MDSGIAHKIKRVVIMGGSYAGRGNTGSHSEWNFACDPEAADIVLRKLAKKSIMISWEMTYYAFSEFPKISKNWFEETINIQKGEEDKEENRISTFMKNIRESLFINLVCDAFASSYIIDPSYATGVI